MNLFDKSEAAKILNLPEDSFKLNSSLDVFEYYITMEIEVTFPFKYDFVSNNIDVLLAEYSKDRLILTLAYRTKPMEEAAL